MTETLRPETPEQLCEVVRWAIGAETSLAVEAGGSKSRLGRPASAAHHLDAGAFAGIVSYEPEELVLTVRAATPMTEIADVLAERHQHLAFEPADHSRLLGDPRADSNSAGTLAGVIACNLSGPRRIHAGAARDHVLGFKAVSGRGEVFKSGGRVVKNVTGFDLSKLIAGSFGTLAVITELSVRALPAAEEVCTLIVSGTTEDEGIRALTTALQSPFEVSGAAHLPADIAAASAVEQIRSAGGSATVIRLEGPAPSVRDRSARLGEAIAGLGPVELLAAEPSRQLWREIRDVDVFAADPEPVVWRLSVPPSEGPRVVADVLFTVRGRAFFDWGGGLIWLALQAAADAHQAVVRAAIGGVHGHATLIRAPEAVRAAVDVFHPQPAPLADLTRRVKAGFDPQRVLNPGRMYADV